MPGQSSAGGYLAVLETTAAHKAGPHLSVDRKGQTPGHTEDMRDLTRGNGFELEPLPGAVKSKSDLI